MEVKWLYFIVSYFFKNASAIIFVCVCVCDQADAKTPFPWSLKLLKMLQVQNLISEARRKFIDVYIMFTFQYRDLKLCFWDYNGNAVQSFYLPHMD